MKVFKYKFGKTTTVFIYVGIALSVVAFALNTYFLFTEGLGYAADIVYPILRYTLMYLISVLAGVILTSLLLSSYYSVSDKVLKTSFGIIKSKYDIAKIESVVLDRKTNKLSVHFNDSSYIVIVVKEEWYNDFTDAILKVKPDIEFSINSKENDIDDKKI
ncbi:MAG: hypothetical protein HDQ88_09930 [Clostridia bacterium]|nr:hypothetical protein [Clostridia bacterium]